MYSKRPENVFDLPDWDLLCDFVAMLHKLHLITDYAADYGTLAFYSKLTKKLRSGGSRVSWG